MYLPSLDEAAEAALTQQLQAGGSKGCAIAHAKHARGNMGYIYGSLMVLPVKIILLVGWAIMMHTTWWDDMTGFQRTAALFGLAWAWWFVAAYFALRARSKVIWVVHTIVHLIFGCIVLSAILAT